MSKWTRIDDVLRLGVARLHEGQQVVRNVRRVNVIGFIRDKQNRSSLVKGPAFEIDAGGAVAEAENGGATSVCTGMGTLCCGLEGVSKRVVPRIAELLHGLRHGLGQMIQSLDRPREAENDVDPLQRKCLFELLQEFREGTDARIAHGRLVPGLREGICLTLEFLRKSRRNNHHSSHAFVQLSDDRKRVGASEREPGDEEFLVILPTCVSEHLRHSSPPVFDLSLRILRGAAIT
mmetsp:Transcript_22052/g.41328  ORF Transcript_22052/g.41328 Transcript_22052/m.41328 type:complete len:234 (+) Transcript_22052:1378-2079(+)